MKSVAGALVALALALPARAEWQPPSTAETALFVAAELLVVVDVVQTRDFLRNADPARHAYEVNPLLGAHPSGARVLATGGVAMLAVAAGWYFLPTPWRDAVTIATVFVEVPNVTHNAMMGARFRF